MKEEIQSKNLSKISAFRSLTNHNSLQMLKISLSNLIIQKTQSDFIPQVMIFHSPADTPLDDLALH